MYYGAFILDTTFSLAITGVFYALSCSDHIQILNHIRASEYDTINA